MTASIRSTTTHRPSSRRCPLSPFMPAFRPAPAGDFSVPPRRSSAPRRCRLASALGLLVLVAGGCRSQERSYPGESPANVWSAARAAAEAPDYESAALEDRWNVDFNEVQVDAEANELEIHRELSRLHLRSGGDRYRERRTWTIGVTVIPDPDAPTVTMVSRGLAVPAHVTAEAERYFDQIADLLRPPASVAPDAGDESDTAGTPGTPGTPGTREAASPPAAAGGSDDPSR